MSRHELSTDNYFVSEDPIAEESRSAHHEMEELIQQGAVCSWCMCYLEPAIGQPTLCPVCRENELLGMDDDYEED